MGYLLLTHSQIAMVLFAHVVSAGPVRLSRCAYHVASVGAVLFGWGGGDCSMGQPTLLHRPPPRREPQRFTERGGAWNCNVHLTPPCCRGNSTLQIWAKRGLASFALANEEPRKRPRTPRCRVEPFGQLVLRFDRRAFDRKVGGDEIEPAVRAPSGSRAWPRRQT